MSLQTTFQLTFCAGQRLASQQLQSDDLVGAMNAEQKAQEDAGSDED